MPSLKTFRVDFDRPAATYLAGETVRGNIILDLTKEKTIKGLKFSTKGFAFVSWVETNTARHKNRRPIETHSSQEEYFHMYYTLLGSQASDSQVTIPPGLHKYPFEFHLPRNIPSSFEHRYGYVRYTVRGAIDRPWKFDHECKAAFTVISPLDLNMHPDKCLGIHDDVSHKFCCFCIVNMGSLNLRIRVPTSGYVSGQPVFTTVDFANTSQQVEITEISAKIKRKLKFIADRRTDLKFDIVEIKGTNTTGTFATSGETVLEMTVPTIPPSNLEYCSIIDLDYQLDVTVHVSGMHCKVRRSYPILIGTVPMNFLPSAPPSESVPTRSNFSNPSDSMRIVPMPMSIHPSVPYPTSSNEPGSSSNWQIPPPSYEECMLGGVESIRDYNDSNYVHGANDSFAPRYPVYNFQPSIDEGTQKAAL